MINSVIQYFPCADYLSQVLQDAVRVTGEHGAVFIGDVRHLGLLDAFFATVQLGRMPPLATVTELAELIARQRVEESELCLAPEWFAALKHHFPSHRIQLALKRGSQANEMSVFRFDVTLTRAQRDLGTSAGPVLDWASSGLRGLDELRTRLQQQPMLQLRGIPNRRLIKPLALLDLLATLPPQTSVWELERQLWLVDESQAIEPEALAILAEQMGLQLNLMLHQDSRMDLFDACFSLSEIYSVNTYTDSLEQIL